jgi:RimJ/RimL family protein N-acetyltransferase
MLTGKRIKLRPVETSDLPIMRRWFDDPETMAFWANPRPFVTERQFESELAGRFSRYDHAGYFIIIDPEGKPIGPIDYEGFDERNRSVEVGILIGEAEARGLGYGPDAVVTLLRYLFWDRNLHRVELTVLAWNERAVRAYRRIGFVQEGIHRDHKFVDGTYVDELHMSLLRAEFDSRY